MNTIPRLTKDKIYSAVLNYKFVVLLLLAMILIIGSILISYTSYATSGNTLEQLQTDAKNLQEENTRLSLEIAKDTSLPQIAKRAQDFGLTKNNQIIVIKAR